MSLLKKLLLSISLATLVVGCTTTDSGRAAITLYDEEYLEYIHKMQFEYDRENLPLVTDRNEIDFVACIANAIVDAMDPEYQEIFWELAILENPAVNASAAPGGKIRVYAGMIDLAENQHELASVMGHELAHVTSKHVNERMSRQKMAEYGIDVASIVIGGGYYNQTNAAKMALSQASQLGLTLPHNRTQESEADEIGLKYMAAAGFDPRESITLWKRMSAMSEAAGVTTPDFMRTHPTDEKRIDDQISLLAEVLPIYNQAKAEGRNPNCKK